MKIGTNIHAMQAYTSLSRSNIKLNKINQRLTTGIRVNSAGDDPTVLTTATKLKTQVNGYEMARQNSSNAISLLQTADGALNTIHSMAQRMRELAVQAANETNSAEDRLKMQEEITQLNYEIDETVRKAEYNGIRLLNGDAAALQYKYTNSAVATNTKITLGTPTLGELPNNDLQGDINFTVRDLITNTDTVITVNLDGTEDTTDKIWDKFITAFSGSGELAATGTFPDSAAIESTVAGSKIKIGASGDSFLLDMLGLSVFSGVNYERGKDIGPNLVTQPEDQQSPLTNEAMLLPPTPPGTAYTIRDNFFGSSYGLTTMTNIDFSKLPNDEIGIISDISTKQFVIQIGTDKGNEMDISIAKVSSAILGADRVNVTTTEFSVSSIKLLDKMISDISDIRSEVGSYQQRLEYTFDRLDMGRDKISTSLSRIWDTDMSVEMSEYAQHNLIIQASLSVLSQSNQRPSEVVALLRK